MCLDIIKAFEYVYLTNSVVSIIPFCNVYFNDFAEYQHVKCNAPVLQAESGCKFVRRATHLGKIGADIRV